MKQQPFFWLHIKKSGGQTIRQLLQPHYNLTERENRPQNFIQTDPAFYNDTLNNYRVVLGEYQFKRALFAKKFLYPNWNNLFSFAFVREPIDRAISMFYYLYYNPNQGLIKKTKAVINGVRYHKKLANPTHYAFENFLHSLLEVQASSSSFKPYGLDFATHVAPVWEDVTDENGNILLTRLYRLEHLYEGLNDALTNCHLPPLQQTNLHVNKTKSRKKYVPTPHQRQLIEKLFAKDFDLYENAIRF